MRRKVLLALLPVLLLLLTPAVALVFEHLRGAGQLRSSLRDLRARGEHLDMARLRPPPPPPASNGMDRLLASVERLDGSADLLPPSLRLAAPGCGIPASRLESWEGTHGANVTWPMVEDWVASHGSALRELQAALAEPVCRPDTDFSDGFKAGLPHLAKLKSASVSLSLQTAHFAHAGDFEAALSSLRSLFLIESVLAHEPITISQIFRVASAAIALNRAWDVVHAQPWSDQQLRRLQEALPRTRFAESTVRGLEGERVLFLISMRKLTAKDLRDMIEGEMFEPPDDMPVPRAPRGRLWDAAARFGDLRLHVFLFGWGDQAQATYLEAMDRLLSAGRSAAAARSRVAFDSNVDLVSLLQPSGSRAAMRTVYARSVTPAFAKSVHKGFAVDVHRDLLATDVALQRHQRRHGRYPESLERLVPDFLDAVPLDAMDGKPLRYRLETDGAFTLWSAGDDRRDDRGDPTPQKAEPTYWWGSRDGVWPRLASEEQINAWVQSDTAKRAQRNSNASGRTLAPLSSELLRRYGLKPPEPGSKAP